MTALTDLYQEILLDHNKRPRNFGTLAAADRFAEGNNPLCGDKIRVQLTLDGDRIEQIAFAGAGCAISTASASMMTEAVKGKTIAEARALFRKFRHEMTGRGEDEPMELGELEALGGVRRYPMRVKCATLAWHTLEAALDSPGDTVSTE